MKKHIMVIDDCYETAKLLATSLQNTFSFHIKYHTNPFKAIEDIKTLALLGDDKLYIICDYMMPQMDGIELYDEISILDKNISFILLTNENDSQVIEEAARKGIDLFLLKQQGFDVIINQINKIINDDSTLGHELIEVFEVTDIVRGFKIVEKGFGHLKLISKEEIPRNAIIKIGTGSNDNDIYRVNSCKIVNDKIEVDCSLLTSEAPARHLRAA
ncbi:response regulator transcription factor [Halobacteriovorax sp.]|uniref:response regulator transcription factor n=1 Tax=Halobacteriovorax sp. TaxID=2020862 RepID=UPI003AF2D8A0